MILGLFFLNSPERANWVRTRKRKRLLCTLGGHSVGCPCCVVLRTGPSIHPSCRMASNGVNRKTQPRTQDAQAQTVEKGETATTVTSQRWVPGRRMR